MMALARLIPGMALFLVVVCMSVTPNVCGFSLPTKDIATKWINRAHDDADEKASRNGSPVLNSVLCFPPKYYAPDVQYLQVATNSRLEGLASIQLAGEKEWEKNFQSDLGNVHLSIDRVSATSPTTTVVQWNLTWVSPTIQWLEDLAIFNSWTPKYVPYVDQAGEVSTVSYKALFRLFLDAFQTNELRIPLTCIQGTTICEFEIGSLVGTNRNSKSKPTPAGQAKIISIREDLAFALDLNQGRLRNRKCAQDLRLFLEVARRPTKEQRRVKEAKVDGEQNWDDVVATDLPWSSVPGMGSLEIDPNASGEEWVPLVFLVVSAVSLITFAGVLAPELIGQSLFGPPNYIVPPSELNSIY